MSLARLLLIGLLALLHSTWIASPAVAGIHVNAASAGEAEEEEPPENCEDECPCPPDPDAGNGSGNGPAPQSNNGGTGGNNPAVCGATADPVETFTGRFRHEHVDLVVEGVYPIRMVRRYDSQSEYDSPLGYGWSHPFDMRLFEYPDDSIIVRERWGRRLRYDLEMGSYVSADPARGRVADLTAITGGYQLRYPTGKLVQFDDEGRLRAFEDAQGNRLEMLYAEEVAETGPPAKHDLRGTSRYSVVPGQELVVARVFQLKRIEERLANGNLSGRSLTFDYDAKGRIEKATASDGRYVTYEHDEPGGSGFRGNLASVVDPEGITYSFWYEDAQDLHNVTSFQMGLDTVASVNVYDGSDRVAAQYTGDPESAQRHWTFDYVPDGSERVTTVTRRIVDADGENERFAVTQFRFNAAGHLIEKVDPLGNVLSYDRDAATGLLETITVERNEGTLSSPSLVTEKTASLTYDTAGDLVEREVDLLDTDGMTVLQTVVETWEYDHHWVKLHKRQIDGESDFFQTTYDFIKGGLEPGDAGYPATDSPENVYSITRRVNATDDEVTTFTYSPINGRLATVTPPEADPSDPDSLTIVRSYVASGTHVGRLESTHLETDTGGGAMVDPHLERSFTYDAKGHLASVTDAEANTTSFEYDDNGRVVEIIRPWTDESQTQTITATLFTYTAPNEGNETTTTPGMYLTTVEGGRLTDPSLVEGQVRRLVYDDRGRLVGVERKDDSATFQTFATFTHDSDDNRTNSTDGEGRETTFAYDLMRRLASVADAAIAANTTTFEYDAIGNRTRVTDALSRDTVFRYDELDRLVEVEEQGVSPALVTAFTYDAAGNVLTVAEPKDDQVTTYTYDGLSRLTSVERDLGESVTYGYDGRGRLESVANARSDVLTYLYHPWGGLETLLYDDDGDRDIDGGERTVSYTYDDNGNPLTATDSKVDPSNPLYTFSYDGRNRVDSVVVDYAPGDPTLAVGYDRFGNRSRLVLDDGGTPLEHVWTYDLLDRLTDATLPGNAADLMFEYYDNDDLLQIVHGGGSVVTALTYHPEGPVDEIDVSDGMDPLLHLDYAVNEVLNVTGIAETRDTGSPQSLGYGYDGVDRLIEADYASGAFGLPSTDAHYVYDDAGNRDDDADEDGYGDGTHSYNANNEITASPGSALLCHDADGNLTSRRSAGDCTTGTETETYTWDETNRLTDYLHVATGRTAEYAYDPFGRRIRKIVDEDGAGMTHSPETTWYVWDGDRLLAEYDASGDRQVRYAYAGGFAPLQVAYDDGASGEDVYDVHSDHLATPRMITDDAGDVVWRSTPEAYGAATLAAGNTLSEDFNIRFPGQHHDAETGLHYNFYRTYDPSIGRYISADPIGQFGLVQWNLTGLNALLPGLVSVALRSGEPANLYQYARANPLSFIDPLGLDTTFVITRDYGVGSHAAVHVDNGGDGEAFLYDPAGSYVPEDSGRGSGDSFSGSEADLQSYIDYQKSTGSTVETYTFNTTPEEEAAIAAAAQKQGGVAPPYCAGAVSSAASAAPPFSGLNASIPGPPFGLRSQLNALQKKAK